MATESHILDQSHCGNQQQLSRTTLSTSAAVVFPPHPLSREADQSTDPPKNSQLKDMDPPDPFPPDTVDESFRPAVVVVVEVALPPVPLLVMSPV